MSWDPDEEDTTIFSKDNISVNLQKVLTTIDKDVKFAAAVRIDADASEEDREDEDFPSFAYVRRNPLPIGETIRPASTTNATMPLSSDSFSAIQRPISLKLSIWPGSWSTAC